MLATGGPSDHLHEVNYFEFATLAAHWGVLQMFGSYLRALTQVPEKHRHPKQRKFPDPASMFPLSGAIPQGWAADRD